MRDDDPNAYKQTSADKDAKTKPSKYTKKFKQMYGELKTSKDIDPTRCHLVYQRHMIWDTIMQNTLHL